MAIQPPSFNISPISIPARRPRQDPFGGILNQIIGISLQARFNEEAAEAADVRSIARAETEAVFAMERVREGNKADQIQDLYRQLGTGAVQIVTEEEQSGLPGLEILPNIAGLDIGQGSVLATRANVQNVTPVLNVLGRSALPGTTLSDTLDPTTGVFSPTRAAGVAQGNLDAAKAKLATMEGRPNQSPAVVAELRAAIAAAESDSIVSLSEEQSITNNRDFSSANWDQLNLQYAQMAQDTRAAVSVWNTDFTLKFEIWDQSRGSIGLRDLNPYETQILAQEAAGVSMSPEQTSEVTSIKRRMRERVTATDRDALMVSYFDQAGIVGSDTYFDFVRWLSGNLWAEPGRIANQALAEEIKKSPSVTRDLDDNSVTAFASDDAASVHLRRGYALHKLFTSMKVFNENLRRGGVYPSIDVRDGVTAATLVLGEAFNDAPLDRRFVGGGPVIMPQTLDQVDTSRRSRESAERVLHEGASRVFAPFNPDQLNDLASSLAELTQEQLASRIAALRVPTKNQENNRQNITLADWLEQASKIGIDSLIASIPGR